METKKNQQTNPALLISRETSDRADRIRFMINSKAMKIYQKHGMQAVRNFFKQIEEFIGY